ncbi:MAG: TIGR03032 family protein [Anaerolineae bacterium]|nr:TIGR03032 family protein [Anaerolineales bacterium]MCQ3977800.1 TIGR03032 family protein [Anaerolineae bacterium]
MTAPLAPFSCTHSPDFPDLLASLGCSLVISTYQAGKVIFISATPDGLIQLPRNFDKPMGLAVAGARLAVATRHEVVVLANAPSLAPGYPSNPDCYDSLFAPRAVYFSGEVDLHDLAWIGSTLWAVNTRFSCLCRIDDQFSFTPVWRPPFVTAFTPDDHCHLNGMALANGQPLYATALGATDSPKGWRSTKPTGGVLLHVPSGEIILSGLAMPHSPRLFEGRLYLLLSASGELVTVEPESGRYEIVAALPGFGRGLARCGDYLFVGLSRLRPNRTFGDLPIARRELFSGVLVLHLPSGQIVGHLQYLSGCEEIYDVQVLPGLRRPGLMGLDKPLFRSALSTPQYGFWSEPAVLSER